MCDKDLPFDRDILEKGLHSALGTVKKLEQLIPGVYYAAIEAAGKNSCDEYFAVTQQTPLISPEAKAYGKPLPGSPDILLYSCQEPDSGIYIVQYEYHRCCLQNHLPLLWSDTLYDIAATGMQLHPEYFGACLVPTSTPYGRTVRHRSLANGVFWLETDQAKEVLVVAFPVWNGLSDSARRLSETPENKKGCLFFEKRASCVPLFELCGTYPEWIQSGLIDRPALMNAVWETFPEYAVALNRREQAGGSDLPGLLLRSFGVEVELKRYPDRFISISPDVGTDFLHFPQI